MTGRPSAHPTAVDAARIVPTANHIRLGTQFAKDD